MTVAPEAFLAAVLPDNGPYIASTPSWSEGKGAYVFYPKHFDSAQHMLEWARKQTDRGLDVYFTPGQFLSRDSKRKTGDVKFLRDLFIDIDTKETKKVPVEDPKIDDPHQRQAKLEIARAEYDKTYATRTDALEALAAAVSKIGLPEPLIVSSGGGLHVHWPLGEALSVTDWRPLAVMLRDHMVAAGLHFDTHLTTNPVCLLRPPGTKNFKRGTELARVVKVINPAMVPPVPVNWLRNHLRGLDSAPIEAPAGQLDFLDGPLPTVDTPVDDSMLADLVSTVEVDSATVYQHCGAMRWCRDNPAAVSEPLWFAGLRVLRFTKDWESAAHDFSRGHPEYSAEQTDSYLHRVQHPAACIRFREQRPEGCKGCPGEHLGSTPHFASRWVVQSKIEPAAIGDHVTLPVRELKANDWESALYERRAGLWTRKAFRDPGGNLVPEQRIMRASLMPVGLLEGRDGAVVSSSVLMRDIHPISGVLHFEIPADTIYSKPKDFQSLLANRHHLLDGKELTGAQGLMKHWQRKLLNENRITYVSTRLGWDGRKGGEQVQWDDLNQAKVFRMPEYTIGATQVEESLFRPKATALRPEVFQPTGTLAAWKEVYAAFCGPEKALLGVLTLSAFASPLMTLLGSEAAILVASDPIGGTGKTSAVRMAASVYSHPGDSRGVVLGGNVTPHAIGVHCATLGDLPAYINELDLQARHTGAQSMAATIYSVVNGSGMTRGRADGTTVTTEAWNLLLTITTNANLAGELVAMKGISQARLQRMLVVTPKRTAALQGGVSARNDHALAANHGIAGRLYLEGLAKNQTRLPAAAKAALEFTGKEFGFESRPEERIRWHTVAALVLGYRLAKAMGLCPLDEADVLAGLHQIVRDNRIETAAAADLKSVPNVLAEFLNENRRSIIRYTNNGTSQVDADTTLIDPLLGRYDAGGSPGGHTLILTEKAIRTMALDLSLSVPAFLDQLKAAGYGDLPKRSTYVIRSGSPSLTLKGYKFNYALLDAVLGGSGDLARKKQ